MDELPNELLKHVLGFLIDDGVSVLRLSLCSSNLSLRLNHQQEIWKVLLHNRWRSSKSKQNESTSPPSNESDGRVLVTNYRQEYIRRLEIDQRVLEILNEMTADLKDVFQLDEDNDENDEDGKEIKFQTVDGDPHIGQSWEHHSRETLFSYRWDTIDILKSEAATTTKQSLPTSCRLKKFLAARLLQNIHFAQCLYEWKEINKLELLSGALTRETGSQMNAILMERYAILVCLTQQSPPELLRDIDVSQRIRDELDEIANTCRRRIQPSMTTLEQIQIVKDVLVYHYCFVGNEGDYYNYKNSMLNFTLESKKGIPLTLCILWICVCRRLDLQVHLIGLPGHVVLGFRDDDDNELSLRFLDVFHQGRILTLPDCQRICGSYGVPWTQDFLNPLAASHVLQRILNNLTNCHFQAMANHNDPDGDGVLFHSDLFFQQRALASIHRQPPEIAGPLVERVAQQLPLTLSPDLLRFYGLLSQRRGGGTRST